MKKPKFVLGQYVYFVEHNTDRDIKKGRICGIKITQWNQELPLGKWYGKASELFYEIDFEDDRRMDSDWYPAELIAEKKGLRRIGNEMNNGNKGENK